MLTSKKVVIKLIVFAVSYFLNYGEKVGLLRVTRLTLLPKASIRFF